MKKRIIIMSGIIVFMLVAYIGFSYALFTKSKEQEGINQITTYNCLNISINGEEELNLTNAYPIKDEEGVLQTPYTFTITNNCNHYVGVDIGVEYLEESTISPSIIKATLNKPSEGIMPQILSSYNLVQATDSETGLPTETAKYIMVHEGLPAGDSQTFEYRMWLDYSVENLSTSDKLKVKIVAIGTVQSEEEAPKNWWSAEEGTLLAALRDNNSVRKPLTTPGRQTNLPTESVLASAEDDYGTSYYYRGNVENNYLAFANKCWRIVRITGNGAIKLFYWGESTNNRCSNIANLLGGSAFNGNADVYQTASGVGLMYGDAAATNYLDAQANIHDSTILTNLKAWYDTAFDTANTSDYTDLLADVIWCGDKSLDSGPGYGNYNDNYSNTFFNARKRVYPISAAFPSLICPNAGTDGKISKYTAKDTIYGNGMLKTKNENAGSAEYKYYKVGLITSDESTLAGSIYNTSNKNYYLYTNSNYWTMSPCNMLIIKEVNVWYVGLNGNLGGDTGRVELLRGFFPMIALIPSTVLTNTPNQDGTMEHPFEISVN